MDEALAALYFEEVLGWWKDHQSACLPWSPEFYKHLKRLIDSKGGMEWVKRRPHLLSDEEPVYHAASYRTIDLRRYSLVLPFEYQGKTLFLRPRDFESLLGKKLY